MFELFNPRPGGRSLLTARPNRWDWALLPLVLAVLAALAFGAMQMTKPFTVGEPTLISLHPAYLPYYLLRTILRMFTALGCALLFSFAFAAIAEVPERAGISSGSVTSMPDMLSPAYA